MIPLAICCIPISAILWVLFFSHQIYQVLISELLYIYIYIYIFQNSGCPISSHSAEDCDVTTVFTRTCVHTLMPTYVLVHILFLVNL